MWGPGCVCVCGGGDDYRGCYVIGEKFDVKFDVTVFDVTVFDVPVFDVTVFDVPVFDVPVFNVNSSALKNTQKNNFF